MYVTKVEFGLLVGLSILLVGAYFDVGMYSVRDVVSLIGLMIVCIGIRVKFVSS